MTIQPMFAADVRGHTRLGKVFWIYGVLSSHLQFGAILYFYRRMETPILTVVLIGFVA